MASLWVVIATALPAVAQEARPVETGDDIVVIGDGLPLPPGTPAYGAVTIGRGRLTSDATGRVEDVLADVAGLQQFRRSDSRSANPSAQGVTVRSIGGNATSRTLVLLDGVPIADPFFGTIPFNALVPDRLAGVRVTRGGGSGAFGAGAVAGTIELVSAGRRDLTPFAGDAFFGSRDAQEVTAALSPTLGAGFATLSGRFERGNGFQTTPPDQRVAASAPARYRDWSLSLRAVVPAGPDAEIQANGLVFGDRRTLRFRGADSRSSGEDASIRFLSRGRWQVDALGYLLARDFGNRVVSATTFRPTLDQRATPSTGLGGKIELRPPVGAGQVLRLGLDARRAGGEAQEDALGATGAVTAQRRAGGTVGDAGLFAEDDWTIGRVILTGGVRLDRWTITGGHTDEATAAGQPTSDARYPDRRGVEATGRGGLAYRPAPWGALRIAGYTAFRSPTPNEFYRSFVIFPVTTLANPALAPERLRGVEAGIDLSPARDARLSLTVFHNRLNGAIANVTITPTLRQRRNVAAIEANGGEVNASWRRRTIDLSASYALDASRVDAPGAAFDGLRPAQAPRQSASGTIAWRPHVGALASLTVRYVGDQYDDDLERDVLPAAVTLDAVARLPLSRRLTIVARAENLLDARVETRNQAGSIDLGVPRTLWIGLRFG